MYIYIYGLGLLGPPPHPQCHPPPPRWNVVLGRGGVVDFSTWLHRLLACLPDFLHVQIDLSIGGSIGCLPVCSLVCMHKSISHSEKHKYMYTFLRGLEESRPRKRARGGKPDDPDSAHLSQMTRWGHRPGKRPSITIAQKMSYFSEYTALRADPNVAYPEKDGINTIVCENKTQNLYLAFTVHTDVYGACLWGLFSRTMVRSLQLQLPITIVLPSLIADA